MWVSPNHPNPPRRPDAPRENGRRLATFDRGQGVEMRATLAEFEGHPYISLRVWERDQAGAWWPTRRGCSVRISEAAELAEALAHVAGAPPGGGTRPARRDPERGPSAPWGSAVAESRPSRGEGFDEFAEG